MAESCLHLPSTLAVAHWVFPKHDRNWLWFTCRCFTCPSITKNDQISHLQCLAFYSDSEFLEMAPLFKVNLCRPVLDNINITPSN
jgi:hypothetical protein